MCRSKFGLWASTSLEEPASVATRAPQYYRTSASSSKSSSLRQSCKAPLAQPAKSPPAETLDVRARYQVGGGDPSSGKEISRRFFIAETEVTNQQYQEFVTETNPKASGWKGAAFIPSSEMNAGISGGCRLLRWRSAKLKMKVRLWLKRRGVGAWTTGSQISQGNGWDDRAAPSDEQWLRACGQELSGQSFLVRRVRYGWQRLGMGKRRVRVMQVVLPKQRDENQRRRRERTTGVCLRRRATHHTEITQAGFRLSLYGNQELKVFVCTKM